MRKIITILAFACSFGSQVCQAQNYNDYMYNDYETRYPGPSVYLDYSDSTMDDPQAGYDYSPGVTQEDNVYVQRVQQRGRYVNRETRHIGVDRLSREEYETRVMREQARQRHLDNSVGRDDAYTDVFESNVRYQERQNIIHNVESASRAVSGVASTIKYIQDLF